MLTRGVCKLAVQITEVISETSQTDADGGKNDNVVDDLNGAKLTICSRIETF